MEFVIALLLGAVAGRLISWYRRSRTEDDRDLDRRIAAQTAEDIEYARSYAWMSSTTQLSPAPTDAPGHIASLNVGRSVANQAVEECGRDHEEEHIDPFPNNATPLVRALYDELHNLEREFTQHIQDEVSWGPVGHVEGLAYDLCSMAIETMPKPVDPHSQAAIARRYLELTKAVFNKYFDDYDEDGFGVASFGPFLRIVDAHLRMHPERLNQEQMGPGSTWTVDERRDWDYHFCERSLISATRAHSKLVLDLAAEYTVSVLEDLNRLLPGHEQELGNLRETVLSGFSTAESSAQIGIWGCLRALHLLNEAGVPFHPIRYEALQILQLLVNTKRIFPGRGHCLDIVAKSAAESEIIARSMLIDAEIAPNSTTELTRAIRTACATSHLGTYISFSFDFPQFGFEEGLPDAPAEERLVGQLNLWTPTDKYHQELASRTLEQWQEVLSNARISQAGKVLMMRAIAEKQSLAGEHALACSTLSAAIKLLNRLGPDWLRSPEAKNAAMTVASTIGLSLSILSRAQAAEVPVPHGALESVVGVLSTLTGSVRDSCWRDIGDHGWSDSLAPDSALLIYYRAMNYLAAWETHLTVCKMAAASSRHARRQAAVSRSLVSLGSDATADDAMNAARKSVENLESLEFELAYSNYFGMCAHGATKSIEIWDCGRAAIIDRAIGDYRGVIRGLNEAEARVAAIPPEELTVVIFGSPDADISEEGYSIPRKAGRIFSNLMPSWLSNQRQLRYLLVVPDGEIHRLPFNTMLANMDRQRTLSRLVVAKSESMEQALKWLQGRSDQQRRVELGEGLAVVNADFHMQGRYESALDLLPSGADEASSIEKYFPVRVLSGLDASKQRLLSARSPAFLHVSSHMLVRDEARLVSVRLAQNYGEYLSGRNSLEAMEDRVIALAGADRYLFECAEEDEFGNGVLSGAEFRALDLSKVQFVFLAGCDSGTAAMDVNRLLQGFVFDSIAAGANFVVASSWSLDDRASTIFVRKFYGTLASGAESGAAFLAALQYTRVKTKRTFEWGVFDFFGNPFARFEVPAQF